MIFQLLKMEVNQIAENISKLNNEGLTKVAEYSKDLVDSHNYEQQ